jgi:hypothetical protein
MFYMKEHVTPLNSFMVCCVRQGMAIIRKNHYASSQGHPVKRKIQDLQALAVFVISAGLYWKGIRESVNHGR